jgi:hypothetical protein
MKLKIGLIIGITLLIGISAAGCMQLARQVAAEGVNAASYKAANGLKLTLSMDAKNYQAGQSVSITIDEVNTLTTYNKVAAADRWAVKGLGLGPCDRDFPVGIAVFSGYYSSNDVIKAKPLIILNPGNVLFCPAGLPSNIPDFTFEPLSNLATIEMPSTPPSTEEFPVHGSVSLDAWYVIDSKSDMSFVTRHDFEPGMYTLVGGDEWGSLVMLHFTVTRDSATATPLKVFVESTTDMNDPLNTQWAEIDVQNISDKPITSLSALYIIDNYQENSFYFDVTPEKPLLPGKSISGFGNDRVFDQYKSYTLKFNGIYQDGSLLYANLYALVMPDYIDLHGQVSPPGPDKTPFIWVGVGLVDAFGLYLLFLLWRYQRQPEKPQDSNKKLDGSK